MAEQQPLVVVGCGIAGLSAAVSALECGLSVTLVERAPEANFGGNTRWTEAYCRMKNDAEIADDFEAQFAANAGWNIDPNVIAAVGGRYADWPSYVRAHPFPDPELIAAFARNVPPTIAWLKGFGLGFGPQPIYLLTQATTRIAARGGGLALIERLMAEARARGARVLFQTTAVDLLHDDLGATRGLIAIDASGRRSTIPGCAVVLASGGFEGNAEMLTRYLGPRARYIRPVAPGGYYNRGEGICMALAAGAAPAGEYGSYHAEPVDPRSRRAEAVVFIWPYGILVNRRGERFADEASGTVDAIYDEVGRRIADQPEGIAFTIFDAQVEEIPRWQSAIRSDQPPYEAATLPGLIEATGLPAATLETIAAFNRACPADGQFAPLAPDGLAARAVAPPKSNWARPVIAAPFRAYPIISANCFTFGGLKVNATAQVLDQDGRVMPGLYAAGETVGLYHGNYPGSTSVLRGAVFGRLAGKHAASVVLDDQGRVR
jgi:tricarballylate dehydrogenase